MKLINLYHSGLVISFSAFYTLV